jgi:predicted DCC family thiol-disulfide oxidoreductase YuxK
VGHPILLYDGVCGLCNRLVQFILKRDRADFFRFASLQSEFAARILARHEADSKFETVYVVLPDDPPKQQSESLLLRSEAVTFVLSQLGGIWPAAASLLRLIPRPIRDWAYGIVARHRYRIFGRYDACPLPTPETRSRFLDQ